MGESAQSRPDQNTDCSGDVMETDMDDFYYCDDADLGTEGFSMGSLDGHSGGRRFSQRVESRSTDMITYNIPSRPHLDISPKRKRNPSLKEASAMGSLAITVSSGSQESSAPALQSPNPQRNPVIVLGVEEPKPSSPGVTFSDTTSVLQESTRNGRAGKTTIFLPLQ